MYLYNQLTHRIQKFRASKKEVKFYSCGPTVYDYVHIGNLRYFVFVDLLKRTLLYHGYKVYHVMNITDVGHLVSDADTGEDKIEVSARKKRKSAWEIARFYENEFKKDLKKLNCIFPQKFPRATEYIRDQIEFIKILEKKGFTYRLEDGIYFDTSKIKDYKRLWGKEIKILPGARVEMVPGKKNPTDFALWKFSPKDKKREMEWSSPWGKGFPGWHTECVVMSSKILGIPLDIHTGGEDHIWIHHPNERAQALACFSKELSRFWVHCAFLRQKKQKMAKSKGNILTLKDIEKKGYHPLALRYLFLNTHYQKPLDFSFTALSFSQKTLFSLKEKISHLKEKAKRKKISKKALMIKKEFKKIIGQNLNSPQALALLHKVLEANFLENYEKIFLISDFDKVFGMNLLEKKEEKIPKKVLELVKKREKYRQEKRFEEADKIREKIKKMGYEIQDTKEGPVVKKRIL